MQRNGCRVGGKSTLYLTIFWTLNLYSKGRSSGRHGPIQWAAEEGHRSGWNHNTKSSSQMEHMLLLFIVTRLLVQDTPWQFHHSLPVFLINILWYCNLWDVILFCFSFHILALKHFCPLFGLNCCLWQQQWEGGIGLLAFVKYGKGSLGPTMEESTASSTVGLWF